MNFEKFLYQKRKTIQADGAGYEWYLIDRKSQTGVNFHGHFVKGGICDFLDLNQHGFAAFGIEYHSKSPMYPGQSAVKDCFVTGGDCYCDGTSMGARESLGHVNPETDDSFIWGELELRYKDYFERNNNED